MNDTFISWSRQRGTPRLAVEGAGGDEFILAGGRRVYDFVSTSFQSSFGHGHPVIVAAIQRQAAEMAIALPKADFPLKRRATERLIRLLDAGPGRIFYTVSGSESVENALKIARRVTGRTHVAARLKSYHGASLGALSVTGDWRRNGHLTLEEYTVRIPEPAADPAAVETRRLIEAAGPGRVAALITETVTGTNGVYVAPSSWWQAIQALCREHGILLICDEVLAGFGRCGAPFAFHNHGVRPDMVCLSKAISGGYIPFGAVWVAEAVARFFDDEVLSCGLTSYAHPLGLAALDAVLDIMEAADFRTNLKTLESAFAAGVRELANQFKASEVRLSGMLAAIEFGTRSLPAWDQLVGHNVYVFTKGNLLILAPPITSAPSRLRQAFADLTAALQESGAL